MPAWLPGLVTVTVLLVVPMFQVKVADPLGPVESVPVTVTLEVPAVFVVPEITPVVELIDRPAGRPLALYDREPVHVSSPCICR